MRSLLAAIVIAPALLASTAVFAAPPAPGGSSVMLDGALVSAAGRPLYVYDRDNKDASACVGPCTSSWLPVLAGTGSAVVVAGGEWSVIRRPDGSRQWAHKGRPVYAFFRDTPGGAAGGDNKVPGWHLLK